MRALSLLVLLPMLSACGGGIDIDLKNVSVADAAQQARAAPRQQPGQWQTTETLLALKSDQVTPGSDAEKQIAQQLNKPETQSTCVSPKQMEDPIFVQATDPTGKCRYSRFKMTSGKIDSTLSCPAPDGPGTIEVNRKGSFSTTAFDITSTLVRRDATGKEAGSMKMQMSAKRTGDCKA